MPVKFQSDAITMSYLLLLGVCTRPCRVGYCRPESPLTDHNGSIMRMFLVFLLLLILLNYIHGNVFFDLDQISETPCGNEYHICILYILIVFPPSLQKIPVIIRLHEVLRAMHSNTNSYYYTENGDHNAHFSVMVVPEVVIMTIMTSYGPKQDKVLYVL